MGSIVVPKVRSRFADLEPFPYDEAYKVQKSFVDDPSPDKITLGAGVYRGEDAKPWTLPSVKLVCGQFRRMSHESHRRPDLFSFHPSSFLSSCSPC